jgi:HK97 family phage major capsid protein
MSEQEILLKKFEDKVGELVENKFKVSEDKVAKLEMELKQIAEKDNANGAELKAEVVRVAEMVEAMKESVRQNAPQKTLKEKLSDNYEKLKALKSGDKSGAFTLKAVDDMSLGNNVTGQVPQAQRIAGLNVVPERPSRFLDVLTRASATSNVVDWVYQSGQEGTAGGTLEGTLKNQIDFDLVTGSQKIEKFTSFIKVTTEMLDDIDFIESEIRNELTRKLITAVENSAYSGNNTPPALNGIYTLATTFAAGASAATIDNANEVDVLNASMVQIMEANQDMPNYIFMHPRDLFHIQSIKVDANDRRYIERLFEVVNNRSLGGVQIIPTTLVSVGTYLMGDFRKAFLFQKEAMNVNIGLDGNDWTTNFRTIIAEWRGATVLKNNDRTAFVKGTFATAKAALETT